MSTIMVVGQLVNHQLFK